MCGIACGVVVDGAKLLDPFSTLFDTEIRDPERAGALRKKLWATHLW